MTLKNENGTALSIAKFNEAGPAELNKVNEEIALQHLEKEKRTNELINANNELAFQNSEKEKRADELVIANSKLAFQNKEKEKRAAELVIANKELAFQNKEKEKRAAELVIANNELSFQNNEKEKRAAELVIANTELSFQNNEKEKRAAELVIANTELSFQNNEKEKRAAELVIANNELAFQNKEKGKRAAELVIANKELAYQNQEKEQRAAELIIANKELALQNERKEKRTIELSLANRELSFQNKEKEKRAAELSLAHIELVFQNNEKEKRAAELNIANTELVYQNEEKEKRAAELSVANKELAFQNKEKEKRAAELNIANIELAFQNEEKEKRAAELIIANEELAFQNEEKEKRAGEIIAANRELAYQNNEKEKRADELIIANIELAFQNDEKEKRAAELKITKKKQEFDTNNLNALINNTNDLMWSVDTDFKLITANAPFNEMARNIFGKAILTGENILHISYSADMLKHFEHLYQRVFDGETFTDIAYFEKPVESWSEISYLPIRIGGKIIGAACHSHDITERKTAENNLIKSEKWLNEGQRIAHIGSWELNFETNTAIWSDEASRIYGVPFDDAPSTYQSWLAFTHPEDQKKVKREIRESRLSLMRSSIKHRILLKDGTIKHIHSITKFAFDSKRKPIGLIGVCHDISEGKHAEENLAQEVRRSKKHQSMLLSSQINPHFIFNALNSVQYFILLKENTECALNFVADFSRLMRTSLVNSQSEFITITDEINFLELYLKLEQQRLHKNFNYDIIADSGVDQEEMHIPPMVIQPYLENAIIHGLAASSEDNKIVIHFSKDKNRIVCKITDNGIGRQKAMELKKLRTDPKKHESMGMKITETKINLLNDLYSGSFLVDVMDLKNAEGNPSGTEVNITFPVLNEKTIFGLG